MANAHGVYLSLRSLRARALSAVGRRDEAAAEYESLLSELAVAFGNNTHQFAVALFEYSVIEQHRGELHHAIELGQRAFAASQTGGSSQRVVASVSKGLAMDYLLARNGPASFEWAAKARGLHDEIFGASDPEGGRFQAVALGQLDEAAVKLQAALAGAEVPRTATPAQAEAHTGLALVLLKRNDPRAALVQATAADEFWQGFDPNNPARKEAAELRSRAMRAVSLRQEN